MVTDDLAPAKQPWMAMKTLNILFAAQEEIRPGQDIWKLNLNLYLT